MRITLKMHAAPTARRIRKRERRDNTYFVIPPQAGIHIPETMVMECQPSLGMTNLPMPLPAPLRSARDLPDTRPTPAHAYRRSPVPPAPTAHCDPAGCPPV